MKCSTHSVEQLLHEVDYLLNNPDEPSRSLLCVNAHIYNLASNDEVLRAHLKNARIVTADGMSIVWFSRLLGVTIPTRCNMTEAFRAFLESSRFRKSRGILIGSTEEDATAAGLAIEQSSSHCSIVRAYSGFLPDKKYKQIFRSLGPMDFIFVGMGTPRTERIIDLASRLCPQAIAWGIGGGTIRIYAGTLDEASPFWRKNGLQWLHRLIHDPLNLWRRYLVGNPQFVYRALRHSLHAKRTEAQIPHRPASVAFTPEQTSLRNALPTAPTSTKT
ncbi:MAG TPA: WecB/TagA/CpsF family glycosyltransferase [Candidatus Hydrogenedentes bacterium]|nr:WecB/TagA/CpsF family glycosyltransferase [Candidatus Hydrogenedentota bacterium]